jgi:hypothetical protein
MAASSVDKITQARGTAGNPVVTTVSAARTVDGTSLTCTALTNWPTDTQVHFITYSKNADGSKNNSSQLDWKGTVSSSTSITSMVLKNGTDAGNAVGDYVEMGPTASWAEDLYDGLTNEHSSAGVHDNTKVAMLAGTQTFTGNKTFSGTVALPDETITFAELLSTIFGGEVTAGTNAGTAGGTVNHINLGGIKLAWGITDSWSTTTTPASKAVTLPSSFFTTITGSLISPSTPATTAQLVGNIASISTSTLSIYLWNTTGSGSGKASWLVLGT